MRRTIQSLLALATALAFVVSGAASRAVAEDARSGVKAPPIPGVDKLPDGFKEVAPGVVTGPPGSYGNAHNGLPNQSHGKCVIVSASNFRPPNPGETPADYGDYIRTEVQKVWKAQFGSEGADYTLHEGTVMGYTPGKGYSVCAVTCAPVPYTPHKKFAVATVKPGDPVTPGEGSAGYHMPGPFYGPAFGTNQHGGCSVAAHEWMGDAVTFPRGAPDRIQNIGKPPRPQPPPPSGGPKPPGPSGPPPKPPGPGGPKPPGPPPPGGPKPPGLPGGPKPPGPPGGPKPPGPPGGPKPPSGGPKPAGPPGGKMPA